MRASRWQRCDLQRSLGAAHHDVGTLIVLNGFTWMTLAAMLAIYWHSCDRVQVYLIPGTTKSREVPRYWGEDPSRFDRFRPRRKPQLAPVLIDGAVIDDDPATSEVQGRPGLDREVGEGAVPSVPEPTAFQAAGTP